MNSLRSLFHGVQALFHKDRRNFEMDEELRTYLEAATADNMRRGMQRGQAIEAARAEMGTMETVKHKVWSAGWESTADSLWQDIRFGARQLIKSPGFSIVAILSLALGIGANTAIFTLINGLLLKQLPVRDPALLVSFGKADGGGILGGFNPGPVDIFSYDFYKQMERDHDKFQGVCAFSSFPVQVSVRSGSGAGGPATQAITHLVSGTFFSVLGADPMLGRAIGPSDTGAPGSSPVAVISHRYWQQSLASDPAVLGRSLTINGTLFTVIGVMPSNFYGIDLNEDTPDMWLPITMQPQVMLQPSLVEPAGLFWLHIMARRNPGVSIGQAQSLVNSRWQQFMLAREGGNVSGERRKQIAGNFVHLLPGGGGVSHLRSDYQVPLAVLMVIVVIVLLIACANLANFLLAKAASREREFSTRLALGSTRGRIVRQVLTETLLLAFIGGALGLALAFFAARVLISLLVGPEAHTALAATPDLRVLAFTSAVCMLTGLLFGIAPALRVSRVGTSAALNANARNAVGAGGASARILPKVLLTAQVMLSLVLVAVAGLFLRTLHNLRTQDLGFNVTNVLLVKTSPKFAGYKPEQLNALYDRILNRVDGIPGVRSASISGGLPIARGNWGSPITIQGRPTAPNEDVSTLLSRVSPGYFETLGIPLLRGRTIGPQDTASSLKSVVVNQTLANLYFAHEDAIGRTFTVADPSVVGTWQIVGIVRDAKYTSTHGASDPMAYLAVEQLTGDDHYAYWLEIETSGDPALIAGQVRAAFAEIDPNLPLLETHTIRDQVDRLNDRQRLISRLSTFFSLLALLLACIGLYGVMTYNVVRRTNEIGIRIALGAQTNGVLWMVLKESIVLLAIGIALGIPATLLAGRAVQSQLFGLTSSDPSTLLISISVIVAVTLAAAYFPARRATRIDPMVALRYE